MMILRGVNVFPTQIEEQVLAVPALAPHFQCLLVTAGRMDEMVVRAERRAGTSTIDGLDAGERLAALVKRHVGVSVRVEVLEPGSVERSAGKMVRVLDQRGAAR